VPDADDRWCAAFSTEPALDDAAFSKMLGASAGLGEERAFARQRIINRFCAGACAVVEDDQGDRRYELTPLRAVRGSYENLVKMLIRPPRAVYSMRELGPMRFVFDGVDVQRTDFVVLNGRGLKLQCSQWATSEAAPCVVYLHGNASSRLEVLSNLSVCLALGLSVVSFDFAGSGISDGEFVSLGFKEKHDVAAVVQHLRRRRQAPAKIAVWGRSMGSVAALCVCPASNFT